jgi:DNA-binding SARP family transcriptional activator
MNEDRIAAFGVRYLRVDGRPTVLRPGARATPHRASITNPLLHMRLLGGFRVERADAERTDFDWPRRSAKILTKLLAAHPEHAMHREQVINILWPDVNADSALNSLGKALHAARRVLEPGLPRRHDSAYLRMEDCMMLLNTEHVVVDADVFERLAADAVRSGQAAPYRAALLAYEGELLPEDRYESWCAERRSSLAEMRIRLLLGLAGIHERCGACNEAADLLREVLRHDPAREAVHRQLMRLYVRMGTADQAVRQFHVCEQVLRQELDLAPQPETVSLYDAIHEDQFSRRPPPPLDRIRERTELRGRPSVRNASRSAFVGREQVIEDMCELLARGDETRAGMVVVSGEAGVGKTRLLEEFAARASEQGTVVLRGGRGAHGDQFTSGPFAVALEDHAARLPGVGRAEVARRYLALARFVPSLRSKVPLQALVPDPRGCQLDLIPSIVQFLTDLAAAKPVLLVLGDLDELDEVGLDLTRYLAHLAARMPLLMAGALRDPDIENGGGLRRMAEAMTRERLWLRMELRCLSRRATDQLVHLLLPGIDVSEDTLTGIYAGSRGNPLFIQELADAIGSGGDAVGAGKDCRDDPARLAARLPARTHALTDLRLAQMEQPLRRVLGLTAAVDAPEISLNHLRAAAAALEPPLAVSVLFDALDHALRLRILEERESGYAFRHPVVRAAVYDCLPRHRRDELRAALAVTGDKLTAGRSFGKTAGRTLELVSPKLPETHIHPVFADIRSLKSLWPVAGCQRCHTGSRGGEREASDRCGYMEGLWQVCHDIRQSKAEVLALVNPAAACDLSGAIEDLPSAR